MSRHKSHCQTNNSLSSNPGVGLRMTAPRIHEKRTPEGPGPQQYDVSDEMTARERAQNELISRRYMKSNQQSDHVLSKTSHDLSGHKYIIEQNDTIMPNTEIGPKATALRIHKRSTPEGPSP